METRVPVSSLGYDVTGKDLKRRVWTNLTKD